MKTSTVGLVLAAILMVLAGVGFGIAQAGGNQSDNPMLSFGDQDVNPYAGQAREAVESGSLPDMSNTDSSNVGTEEQNYLGGEDIDSSKVEIEGYAERGWKGDIDGH